jgi:TonB family protein
LKRVVRENHEFLADTGVLSKGVNRVWYKQLLLNQYVGQQYIISNSFNYSLIKKRIKMMSKLRSKKYASIKYLFGIVAATALLVTFGCEQNNALPEEKKPLFFIVEQMPGYPGGEEALLDFIASTVKYPDEAMEKGIEGRVYVSFTISDKGKVMDAKIAKGVDPLLDKEALRVIKSMPDWKPGMQRGVFVNVQFTVPINFSLGEK